MLAVQAPLLGRAILAGVPSTALQQVLDACSGPKDWLPRLSELARRFATAGDALEEDGAVVSARNSFRAAAAAYQAATFGAHLDPDGFEDAGEIVRLRGFARDVYSRALSLDPHARFVDMPLPRPRLTGVLRCPGRQADRIVLLLNGLDSISDAELHGFGDVFLERGAAVLALDVPAAYREPTCPPVLNLADLSEKIAVWIDENLPGVRWLHAFGVSYGGLLAAQLLAGDTRFESAVALSPPAWMPRRFLRERRLRLMLAALFRSTLEDVDTVLAPYLKVRLDDLAAPMSPTRIYATKEDTVCPWPHVDAFRQWGGKNIEIRRFDGEHVGTTQFHWLIPGAADWLLNQGSRPDLRTVRSGGVFRDDAKITLH